MARTNVNFDKNNGKRSRPPPKLAFNSSKTPSNSKAIGGNKTPLMPLRVVVNAGSISRGGSNGAGSSSSSFGPSSSSSSSGSDRGGASRHVQFADRQQKEKEKKNADADIVELEPPMKKKPPPPPPGAIPPSSAAKQQLLQLVPHNQQQQPPDAGKLSLINANSTLYNCAKLINATCSNSNLVTFHDVDTFRGTIGKITFQFQCHKCRNVLGGARCFRGAAFCISCCGHPQCGGNGNQLAAPRGGGNGGQ